MKYTFSSDEEDDDSAPVTRRRSSRQSGVSTPSVGSGQAVFTASGRQVKPRVGGVYGEKMHSGQTRGVTPAASVASFVENGANGANGAIQPETSGRTRRSGLRQSMAKHAAGGEHIAGYNEVDEMDDEEEAASSGVDDYADDKDGDYGGESAADEMTDDELDFDELDGITGLPRSLIVILKYRKELLELLPPNHSLRSWNVKSILNGDSIVQDNAQPMINGNSNNSPSVTTPQLSFEKDVPDHLPPTKMSTTVDVALS